MSQTLIFLTVALPTISLLAVLYWADRMRRREALFRWASASGFRVLSYRQPLLTEFSAFPLAGSKAQHVFHVEVEDCRDQARKSGWVRLGSAWRGVSSSTAEVRWVAA